MDPIATLDAAGRPRSLATLPGYHAGRAPRNKGRRYPADPPRVEEIVAVMRRAGERPAGLSKKARQSLKVAGAKGDTGATGPPGLARAYGHVVAGVLDTARDSRGIVSARASGSYSCVKLDSSIDASKVSPIVSNDFPSGFVFSGNVAIGISQPFVDAGVCDQPNEVGVASDTFRLDGTEAYGIFPGDFFILIP